MERSNVTIIFANIRTSQSTYYLLYDTSHSKTHTTIITFHFQFCYKFRLHQLKKKEKLIGGFCLKIGENRNRLKK